ncbi:hypothetical protein [Streptomyces marincola]|uniref:Uncharacterized protein n=1 Tax=Streptomyces marincola TaxID=2878388 RepID=A0A1W7CYT3_9ACTN|nr:hypothetical protein [Streptomyces marincola]ARQ69973.1 hypothetical protein CAG99_14890 [Streptomyces marincola]
MNPTPDAPRITLHRTDHPTRTDTLPTHPPPGGGAEITPQQLALLAALIHHTPAQAAPQPDPTPHPAPDTHRDTRVSGRAKDVALMAAAGGTGLGAATAGIGYGSGLIASASGGLMTAALALAIATGTLTGAAWLLRAALKTNRTDTAGGDEQQPTTHITQHVTATGLFGRANGTINHR